MLLQEAIRVRLLNQYHRMNPKLSKLLKSDNNRSEKMKKNIAGGFILRGVGIIISLLLVPMTINYVSSELYGVWLTLSAIIHWISFFDIGFGMGLRNKLSVALAEKDLKSAKILVSSTYAVLTLIFIPLSIILFVVCKYVNWALILNVFHDLNPTIVICSRIVVVSFCFTLILKVIQNVLQAYQRTALSGLLDTISNLFTLFAIFVLTKTTFPSLSYLAFVFSTIPVFVYLIYSIIFYSKSGDVSPSIKCIRRETVKDVFGLGSKFFFLQISFIIVFQTTNVLISQFAGPEQVTVYNVTFRYMSIAQMVLGIVMAPVWSAMTEAYTVKDWKWIKSTYKRLITFYRLTVISLFFMLLISPFVFKIWLGDSVATSFHITALVGLFISIHVWHTMHATVVNGMGILKLQLYITIVQLILFPVLSYLLGHNFALIGIIISNCIVVSISGVSLSIQVRKVLSQNASGIWVK